MIVWVCRASGDRVKVDFCMVMVCDECTGVDANAWGHEVLVPSEN